MHENVNQAGLAGVIAMESAISSVDDGLRYRGYAIEELAAHTSFEEVAHLLIHGSLPDQEQLAEFRLRLATAARENLSAIDIIDRLPPSIPLMDVLRTGVSLLAHEHHDRLDDRLDDRHDHTLDDMRAATIVMAERLLAQAPVLLARVYRQRGGETPISPNPKLSFVANLLAMVLGRSTTPEENRALETSLIMYAEQELNASSFTVRVMSSTGTDYYSAIVGAIGALKGPLHGGANERVIDVLHAVGHPDRADAWVAATLGQGKRVMGFGHRVFMAGDPRALFLQPMCLALAITDDQRHLEAIAERVESAMLRHKGLRPNVDWPTARLYAHLGIPQQLFTPFFAISRISGWSAHVLEQLECHRIIRPRARYIGPPPRSVPPLAER